MNDITVIDLNSEDLQRYLAFREHEDAITTLLASGIFKLRDATASIYIDHSGKVIDVRVTDMKLFSGRNRTKGLAI